MKKKSKKSQKNKVFFHGRQINFKKTVKFFTSNPLGFE
jgi:hypothetical protein